MGVVQAVQEMQGQDLTMEEELAYVSFVAGKE